MSKHVDSEKCRLCEYDEIYKDMLYYQCWLGEQESEELTLGNITYWGRR
ncbi:hypothetical protein ES702_01820 [subsurface metagenome]